MTESQKAVQVDGAGAATRNRCGGTGRAADVPARSRRGDIAHTLVRLAFFAVAVALGFICWRYLGTMGFRPWRRST